MCGFNLELLHLKFTDAKDIVLQISGTALVLDEIINYVQYLQRQVEVTFTDLPQFFIQFAYLKILHSTLRNSIG